MEDLTTERRPLGDGDRLSANAEVAAAIDAAVSAQVLVEGSLPPEGRDLDLLAGHQDYVRIRAWLQRAGFVAWRHTWARFDPTPYAVELSSTDRWRTSRDDASTLFTDAKAIPGYQHLVSPAPATVLLFAARGTVTRRGLITEKVRRRVADALERDPDAWLVAERHAAPLGVVGALHMLRMAYEESHPLTPIARAAQLAGVVAYGGPLAAKSRVLVGARPRKIRPPIVSFSGLDGSGKSTQVDKLQEYLAELGVRSERQWAGFKIAKQLREAIPLLDRPPRAHVGAPAPRDQFVPGVLLRHPLGQQAWVSVIVGLNTFHLWRLVLRRRPGKTVVIFDRFTPDSTVKIDLRYLRGRNIDTRWQRRLFTLISPKPDVGFLMEVPSEVACARRQQYPLAQVRVMAELYEEQVDRYHLHVLPGEEPPDLLAKRVAVSVWRGLP